MLITLLAYFIVAQIKVSLKELLLKIGFIKEMKTTLGNYEVPLIFLPNSPYSRKYYLLRLTQYQFATS